MDSFHQIREYARNINAERTEKKIERDRNAADFLRSLGLTSGELDRYQAWMVEFEGRFNKVMARYPKLGRLIR